jgi:hypothetical protein
MCNLMEKMCTFVKMGAEKWKKFVEYFERPECNVTQDRDNFSPTQKEDFDFPKFYSEKPFRLPKGYKRLSLARYNQMKFQVGKLRIWLICKDETDLGTLVAYHSNPSSQEMFVCPPRCKCCNKKAITYDFNPSLDFPQDPNETPLVVFYDFYCRKCFETWRKCD